jgi:hypothetical protein
MPEVMDMKKECKIVCEGKEVATINHTSDGFSVKCTSEGKELCKHYGCHCV